MAAKDFKFISPGVFINEIDNSQLPNTVGDTGPVIIGRAQKGPGLIPTTVNSFQEFVQIFGAPVAGTTNSDVFRHGNSVGTTYGAYAAQAWLRNNTPVTYVRLVGKQHNDATSDGTENNGFAGWRTTVAEASDTQGEGSGGAYGLFVVVSSSTVDPTGTLAAVWYVNSGTVALSGASYGVAGDDDLLADDTGTANTTASLCRYFKASAAGTWKAQVRVGGTTVLDTKFNITDASSENFIRKVFNTNPTLSNTTITPTDSLVKYWLGESYEDEARIILDEGTSANQYAFIAPLESGSTGNAGDKTRDYADPRTGWFIAQDITLDSANYDAQNMQKLFRVIAKNTGRWASRNLKISIADLRAPTDDFNSYGTFSIQIRDMKDTDNRPKILEQFNGCNLNPASENYIARRIGNTYLTWGDEDRRYRTYGDFPSRSSYIYIEMADAVHEAATDPQYLPFGVFGPPIFKDFLDTAGQPNSLVTGGMDYQAKNPKLGTVNQEAWAGQTVSGGVGATYTFPSLRNRISASEGNPVDPKAVYFGVDTTFDRSGRPSVTIGDYTGPLPSAFSDDAMWTGGGAGQEFSWVFTLDDICNTDVASATNALTGTNVYSSGSRQDGAPNAGLAYANSTSWKNVLDAGANEFTTVLHGGFDGLNIKETEPFRNTIWSDATSPTELDCYSLNSVRVAIDSLRDPEVVEFDLAAMPGITFNALNRSLVDLCESRGDSLAVIDLKGGYVPSSENADSLTDRMGSVASTIDNKKQSLQINSSFGCAYYPWVQIQDTINGALVWAPPSVAAIGAMSYGQAKQELWFAPAGFTRGGLSVNNSAGIPVTAVRERLISRDRDKLYEANINPIAQFPAEGIVIFGQKTLQVTHSALDRINVRRLLIYIKRQISKVAATLLFDQNVESTWNRFRGQVGPILADVKARLGLEEYKLILDETTTTPDLIDRNIMYAQIFLKPTRAIEFIAIDFVITDSGAAFED